MSALPVHEYVTRMEAMGFGFQARRRGDHRELCLRFPIVWPSKDETAAVGPFDPDREHEVYAFIATRDGVLDLPPFPEGY